MVNAHEGGLLYKLYEKANNLVMPIGMEISIPILLVKKVTNTDKSKKNFWYVRKCQIYPKVFTYGFLVFLMVFSFIRHLKQATLESGSKYNIHSRNRQFFIKICHPDREMKSPS